MANEKSKKMNASKVTNQNNTEKLSYDDLERVAFQLKATNTDLYRRLQSAEATISEFNEIGMLLSIIDKSEHFSEKFVTRCSSKIEEIVTKALDNAEKQDNGTSN